MAQNQATTTFGTGATFKDYNPGSNIIYAPNAAGLDHQMMVCAYGSVRGEGKDPNIQDTFVFPFPTEITEELSAEWEMEESKAASFKDKFKGSALNFGSDDYTKGNIGTKALTFLKKSFGNFGNMMQDLAIGKQDIQRNRGLAKNTHQEYYFKSIAFREFQFTQKMYPRNPEESRDCKRIIDKMKYHSLPGTHVGSRYFTYPATFQLHFISDDKDNPWLVRISDCILSTMSVNYTPDEGFQSLPNDEPIGMEIQMTFKELDLVTRESMKGMVL